MGAALVLAAGAGARLGAGLNKALLPLGGAPILAWSVRSLAAHPEVDRVVVVGAEGELQRCREVAEGACRGAALSVVAGGATRQESERRGLECLFGQGEPTASWVLVHDAARPFVTRADLDRLLSAVARTGGALLAVPAGPLARLGEGGTLAALERGLWLAQTPQGFRAAPLLEAHRRAAAARVAATDTAAVAEWAGLPVEVVAGSPGNLKITLPADLRTAERAAERLRGPFRGPAGPPA